MTITLLFEKSYIDNEPQCICRSRMISDNIQMKKQNEKKSKHLKEIY